MGAGSRYVHGTAPEEQERLSSLNDLLNEAALREMALRPGDRVVDFGAGLGQLARAMARATRAPVVCIERSAAQIDQARKQAAQEGEDRLLDLREGDALAAPLSAEEWGRFDVAHARFLLEHVPAPGRVVETMVRAVRPGGRIVLQDDDHDVLRLHPEPPGLAPIWQAYVRSYDRNGNDPFVGRRLPSLLAAAGARPSRCTWLFFGACEGDPRFAPLVDNTARILEGARPALLEASLATAAQIDSALDGLRRFRGLAGAAFWFSVCYAEGVRP